MASVVRVPHKRDPSIQMSHRVFSNNGLNMMVTLMHDFGVVEALWGPRTYPCVLLSHNIRIRR